MVHGRGDVLRDIAGNVGGVSGVLDGDVCNVRNLD